MQEYFVYFKFYKPMDWGKRFGESRSDNGMRLPYIKLPAESKWPDPSGR